ncbi:MAG: PspC domain-containing protein [Spirochaetaceae bacterium]|jgi:phage shock protein C|nr:PspC domain-containing protein [Spirochaetaceae bacterium]
MGTDKLYRVNDSKFLGLCEGISRWRDIPVFFVRAGFIIAAFMTGFFPMLAAYIVISLIVDTQPATEKNDYYHRDSNSRKDAGGKREKSPRHNMDSMKDRVKRKENDLERRFQEELG